MHTRALVVFSALTALVIGAAGPASASSDHGNKPPGNNGTIKIDEYPMDGGNGNDPHVGCQFSVNFFGYDGGTQKAQLVFDAHAPTKGGNLETDNTSWTIDRRTSGNQLDKNYGPVDLTDAFQKAGISPAKQGYHVKLTVHVTGSQGSDAKHKVFWVEPCNSAPAKSSASPTTVKGNTTPAPSPSPSTPAAPATPAPPAPAPATPAPATPAPATPAPAPAPAPATPAPGTPAPAAPATAGTSVTPATPAPAAPTVVLGETINAPASPAVQSLANTPSAGAKPVSKVLAAEESRSPSSGSLPFTGARVLLLSIVALALIAAGVVAMRLVRRSPA